MGRALGRVIGCVCSQGYALSQDEYHCAMHWASQKSKCREANLTFRIYI